MNRVFEQLAQRLTLVHYDGRGTGHSQRDVTDLSLDAMVADLEAVLDRAGLTEVSLLGQYNSCPHAIAYAARHPRAGQAAALFAGSARGWNAMSAKPTQALLSLIEQDWDLFADTAAHQWMGWSAGEAGRAFAEGFRGAVTPRIARATMQAASAVDVTSSCQGRRPALVIHPRDMTQIPIDVARYWRWICRVGGWSCSTVHSRSSRRRIRRGCEPACWTSFATASCPPRRGGGARTQRAAMPALPNGLSRREMDVLRLVAAGDSNSQIARRLGLSTHTVERHLANLYRKIGARGRADATAFALRNGLA